MVNGELFSESPQSLSLAGAAESTIERSNRAGYLRLFDLRLCDSFKTEDWIHHSPFITHPSSFLVLGRRRSLGLLFLHGLQALVGISLQRGTLAELRSLSKRLNGLVYLVIH
jgi:hypothetical protein